MEALEAFRQGLQDANDSEEDTEVDDIPEEGQLSEEEISDPEELPESEDENLPKKSTDKKKENNRHSHALMFIPP